MESVDKLPIVREGRWLYDKTIPVRVRILQSPETWGTGDYEDDETIAESHPIECYFVVYESAGSPGRFNNIVPNHMSIEEASRYVEKHFPGIEWL